MMVVKQLVFLLVHSFLMVEVGGPNSGNASGSVWLDTIPRGSQVTLSKTNFNIGETIRIYTNEKC